MEAVQIHFDSNPTDNEILADKISTLAAHIYAATYRFLVLLREFDQREAWADMGSRTCAHWLNWRCGMSVHTAREKVRVAHALALLPDISASFERGELSYSKVRAVTRVATPDNEDTLLNIALSGTASQLERVVRCEVRMQNEAQVREDTQASYEMRSFTWARQADGSVSFYGQLPAELAEHVITMINTNLPPVSRADPGQPEISQPAVSHPDPGDIDRDQLAVEADPEQSLSESITKDVPAGTHVSETLCARRADALIALCSKHCEGYEVTLHVPAGRSMRANALNSTGTIPAEAARRICCDAAIVPITEDEHGNLLDIGRRTRRIPSAIRRALQIRDKGCCRFPGCTSQHFLKAHHIEHWAHGGETRLDNLVSLCWQHHHAVHEGGYGCRTIKPASQSGVNIEFSTPDGELIPNAYPLNAATEKIENHYRQLGIDAHTCMARDASTSIDVNTVIDALGRERVNHGII